jgi:hypothetical protein
VQANQIRQWRKQFGTRRNSSLQNRNMNAQSFCRGRVSLLEPFEDEILQWLFLLREQGMPVSNGMIGLKARKLAGSIFQSKSEEAQYMICYRFLASHKYGIRIGTHHVLQCMTSKVCDEAKKFVAGLQTNAMQHSCRDPRFVLNMPVKHWCSSQ